MLAVHSVIHVADILTYHTEFVNIFSDRTESVALVHVTQPMGSGLLIALK